MKKNILLILLSAALLTGCEFDITLQRLFSGKNSEEETQQKEENNGNSQENHGNSGENEGSSGESEGNEQGGEQSGGENQTYTTQVFVSGNNFKSVATAQGVSMDTTLSSGNNGATKLINCINEQLDNKDLLKQFECKKLNSAVWDSDCMLAFSNGSFDEAWIKWTSKVNIYKVEINVQCYSKVSGATDRNAHISIDDLDCSLEIGEDETPAFKVFSKEYAEGTKNFKLEAHNGRVLMKSFTITWGN